MYKVVFPPDRVGIPGEETTIAEILSQAVYATAFYGKWHLGDIEESYPFNQGYDETLFSLYNQWPPMSFTPEGELQGFTYGWSKDQWDKNYAIDQKLRVYDYLYAAEGKKGGKGREWAHPSWQNYQRLHDEIHKRSLEFIRKNVKATKPFFLAYWPNLPADLIKNPDEPYTTSIANKYGEGLERFDKLVGEVIDTVKKLGIAENTLIVAMSDNGPMLEIAPDGPWGIFRGGKGDFTEGGVRVPAYAWWPGMIEPDQVAGDIIHVTDLFSTFARLGGCMDKIPTDRVIDGIDQIALLLNGDGHGRRDYVHIYTGPILAATVKQQYKRHWVGERPGIVGQSMFDLYKDPREEHGRMAQFLWLWAPFDLMKERHLELIKKFPHTPPKRGKLWKGLTRVKE
jgi:arylsulfatase